LRYSFILTIRSFLKFMLRPAKAAAWLLDYRKPSSKNYDAARVAKEAADAAAAWAVSTSNPDSLNYINPDA
jgi:hypothetical protein